MTIIIPPSSDSTPPTSTPRVKALTTYSETSPLAVAPESPISEVTDTFEKATLLEDAVKTPENHIPVESPLNNIEDVNPKDLSAQTDEWVKTLYEKTLDGLSGKQQVLFKKELDKNWSVIMQHLDEKNDYIDHEAFKKAYQGLVDHSLDQVQGTKDVWQDSPPLPKSLQGLRERLYESLTKNLSKIQSDYFQRHSDQEFKELETKLGLMYQYPSAKVDTHALELVEKFNTKLKGLREQILDPRKFNLDQWRAKLEKKYTQGLTEVQHTQFDSLFTPFLESLLDDTAQKYQETKPSADELLLIIQALEDGVAKIANDIKNFQKSPPKATTYYGGGGGGGYRKAAKADTPVEVKAPEAPDVTVPENVSKTVKEGTKTLEKEGGPVKVALAVGAGALAIGAGVWVYLQNKASQVVASTVAPTIAQGGKDPNALPSSLAPTTPAPSKIIVA